MLDKKKRPPVSRWRRVAGLAGMVLVVALAVILLAVYRAISHVPEFYHEALTADPNVQRAAGYQLEQKVMELASDVQRPGTWEQAFTDEQVNGWLAVDLGEKFPNLLPSAVSDPRITIREEEVALACRYHTSQFDMVISLVATVALTEEPNVVAVRVRRARAGALPIPLSQFLDDVSAAAARNGLDIRWSQAEGDPVALIRLPTENTELPDRTLHLEAIELKEGEAVLSGRTLWKEM